MNNSAAQLAPGASVEKPRVTVALSNLSAVLNDYLNSRYSALHPESARHHAARIKNAHTPFADRFTGGATTNSHAGRADRIPGSSLENPD
jgi:hypothetical protein